MISLTGQSALEGVDITGQEDPVILHAVIAAMAPQAAYKEGIVVYTAALQLIWL